MRVLATETAFSTVSPQGNLEDMLSESLSLEEVKNGGEASSFATRFAQFRMLASQASITQFRFLAMLKSVLVEARLQLNYKEYLKVMTEAMEFCRRIVEEKKASLAIFGERCSVLLEAARAVVSESETVISPRF